MPVVSPGDAPYCGKGLPIYLIGLNFDSKTRHLADAGAEKSIMLNTTRER